MDCLIQLGHTKPSPMVVAPTMGPETPAEPSRLLHRRMCHLESSLKSINLTAEPLTPEPDLDAWLVRQLEKQVSHINAEHSYLTRDILSLQHKDHDRLALSSALGKILFDLSLQIERLLSD